MKAKFAGFLMLVAMTGYLSLASMTSDSNAGLFGNAGGPLGFGILAQNCGGGGAGGGLQSYASCGGSGGLQSMAYSSCGGGGGGLQSYGMTYSSCGGGDAGGGGGLQFAPQAYMPPPMQYYAPATQYSYPASGCPGGVCPPSMGAGLTYMPTQRVMMASAPVRVMPTVQRIVPSYNAVPAGINLRPGEHYVAGSLRAVASKPVQVAKAQPAKRVEEPAVQVADKPKVELAKGTVLFQITQENCNHCENDRRIADEMGLSLKVLDIDVDTEDVVSLCVDAGHKIQGYPTYFLVADGHVQKWRDGAVASRSEFEKMVRTSHAVAQATSLAQTTAPDDETLARLEKLMLAMIDEQRETNKAIKGLVDLGAK